MGDIKEISVWKFNQLHREWERDRNSTEKGLFWYKGCMKYVGIDNSTGDFWIECFATYDECMKWLKREDLIIEAAAG